MTVIGRAAELAALRRTIDRDPAVEPNLVLHGDPGVGKTVLLRAGIEYAVERGMRVLGGSGYESEAQLAFAGLHQLFAPVLSYFDRVEPYHREVLRRVLGFEAGPVPDRLAVSVASLAVLAEVAKDGPVLVAVEDAHWVDRPTREVMMFLLLRLGPYDLRAIFARRPLLSSERVTPGIHMHEVDPLDDAAAAAFLAQLHPGLPERARDRVLRYAAGNPLALVELPTVLGTDAATGLELLPAGASTRTKLEATYAGRVRELDTDVRRTLLLTALDGDRLENRAHPTSLSPPLLAELERLGLVTRDSTPSGLRFRHPLVRSAIIDSAAPDELRAANAELAELYRDTPQRRVWHLAEAAVEADEDVAAEIERTALAASLRGGSGLAVPALRRAAALSPDPADAARRLHRGAELAGESGQLHLAQKLLDEARDRLDDPAHGLVTRARIVLLRDGDLSAARRLLEHTPLTDRVLHVWMVVATYAQEPDDWVRLKAGLTNASEHTRLVYGVLSGTVDNAYRRLREAFDLLPASVSPGRVVELCMLAAWLDCLHEHRARVRELIDRESGTGAVTHAAAGYWLAAHDHFLAGSWEAAETAAEAGLDLCVRHDLELIANDLRCTLGWLAASRGDVDTAREYSHTVERWAEPRGSALHLALSARNSAAASLADGDYETAYVTLAGIAKNGDYSPWLLLDLVESAIRTRRVQEALACVEAAECAGLAERSPRVRLHVFAAKALSTPDDDNAVGLFRAALALPLVEQWPFDHARVRLALGELHRRRHRPGEARPELRRAVDLFRRVGATTWQRRAEQELRATGLAVNTEPDTAALTAQQLEVAKLAASGLSNKEIGERLFLSPRTVSAHLYRVFPKLGITSRSALRDALARL
ncbi:AAA family ATPase [Actinokineospora diospyrosa]|uniref:AAA ATPase domain-containing protein n=1 Tax=Actinokineospora diospyrosa TaxID=103728 RepID=A0ABT1INK4_9PSEU|nr:LuxR family transcriptional regulator [Actinokineospora diospyrosa]MCP2274247.1 AAA ATPase domain-containing protein [Actinokineospora diospyrosa]